MDAYFLSLVDKLTLDDIQVLNILTSKESLTRYSARTKKESFDESQLTESKFRKVLYRLEAMNFVEVVSGSREHLLYVTEFGQQAIQTIYERNDQ